MSYPNLTINLTACRPALQTATWAKRRRARSCSTVSADTSPQLSSEPTKRTRSTSDSAAHVRASVMETGLRARSHASPGLPAPVICTAMYVIHIHILCT